jgi:hypothetical protein
MARKRREKRASKSALRRLDEARRRLADWTKEPKRGEKGFPKPVPKARKKKKKKKAVAEVAVSGKGPAGFAKGAAPAYRKRAAILRDMGFESYGLYLLADLWGMIRTRVLAAHPHCIRCHGEATQVHHCSYSKRCLQGKDDSVLVSVCAGCHVWAEFKDGKKVGPRQATTRLRSSP